MTEKRPFRVQCQVCGDVLAADRDLVGVLLHCPNCNSALRIPLPAKAAKLVSSTKAIRRLFTDDERQTVEATDSTLLRYLENATNRDCWEFGLLARLLHTHLDRLSKTLVASPKQPRIFRPRLFSRQRPPDFPVVLTTKCNELIEIIALLDALFAEKLEPTLYENNVEQMLDFGAEFGGHVERLRDLAVEFYQLSVPADPPYPALLEIMQGWPKYCCRMMIEAVQHLDSIYQSSGAELVYFEFQVSLIPPDLYRFFSLMTQLPKRRVFENGNKTQTGMIEAME